MRLLLAIAFAALFPTLAFAHSGAEHAAGFVHGFEHPLGGIDHMLAMLAVGVLAYVLGGRALWLVPLSFVGMMLIGFLLGANQVGLPFVELGVALSSVIIGAAAAAGRPMPVAAAMGLVGVFAVFHGHAHGAEMPADMAGLQYAGGFLLATAGLHAIGLASTAFGATLLGRLGKSTAQLAGAAFALGGIGVLAGWL